LGRVLGIQMIDKDEILEALFEERGIGDRAWKKKLSRESDAMFERQARASAGAVLVSHWHVEGMPEDSGTRVEWIGELASSIVNVHCVCDVETAARRFFDRKRHAGHLDSRSIEEVIESLRKTERCGELKIGKRIDVDTACEVDIEGLARAVVSELGGFPSRCADFD